MKKIINGKRYDTEKATLIGEGGYAHRGNHSYYWEALYRTAKGRFFVAREGGPNSKYAEPVDHSTRSGDSAIIPLEAEEARTLAERLCDEDTISQYFDIEDA